MQPHHSVATDRMNRIHRLFMIPFQSQHFPFYRLLVTVMMLCSIVVTSIASCPSYREESPLTLLLGRGLWALYLYAMQCHVKHDACENLGYANNI